MPLINNITLLISLVILYGLVVRNYRRGTVRHSLLSGVLFSAVSVIGMKNAFVLAPGLIFDGRSIIISIASFIGGPITGSITVLVSSLYRIMIGGPGTLMGVSVIIESAVVGLIFFYLNKFYKQVTNLLFLLFFGFIVHAIMIMLMHLLPGNLDNQAFVQLSIPVITIYPIATVILCLFLFSLEDKAQSEDKLEKSEKNYRELTEGANSIFLKWKPDGTISYMNNYGLDLFRFEEKDIVGRNVLETIVPQKESTGRDLTLMVKKIRENPEDYTDNLNENICSDGKKLWIKWRNQALRDENGEVREILSMGIDVSESVQAETLFSKVFNNTPIGILITRVRDVKIIEANAHALQLIGYEYDEAIGKVASELFNFKFWGQFKDREEMIRSFSDSNQLVNYESELIDKNGKTHFILFSSEIIHFDGEDALLTVVNDLTEQKETEIQNNKLEKQLGQSQKMEAIGRLAGGIAHDFNNMLVVILGNAQMALSTLSPDNEICSELKEIEKAANRSSDLTRQLLSFSRKQVISPQIINLNSVIMDHEKMLSRVLGEEIKINTLIQDNLWDTKIDPSQIDQILMNLAVNARDAISGAGEITIETSNIIIDENFIAGNPLAKLGEYIVLIFSDTGCGMDKEVCNKIFEPFFTTKSGSKGTGLGLSTVYGIVQQNEGIINVYSEKDIGTTFKIYLPRHEGEFSRLPAKKEIPLEGNETIVLAEDEIQITKLVNNFLNNLGYNVLISKDVEDAVSIVENYPGKIDLLITDVIMPVMNGKQLKDEIEKYQPEIKTLFMSGYAENIIVNKGVLDRGLNFIQKPFSNISLAEKIREILSEN